MPRTKRHDRRRRRFTPMEAFWSNGQLRFGPWKLSADGRRSDWSLPASMHTTMFRTGADAREAMLELEANYEHWEPLDEDDWCYWRFERGLSASAAYMKLWEQRHAEEARREAEYESMRRRDAAEYGGAASDSPTAGRQAP